ncbi:MAG: hypothetical protein RIR06_1195, partial [Bacteroidota bacterium]
MRDFFIKINYLASHKTKSKRMKKLFTLAGMVSTALFTQAQINPLSTDNQTPFSPKAPTAAEM